MQSSVVVATFLLPRASHNQHAEPLKSSAEHGDEI